MTDKNKVFDTIVRFFKSKLGIVTVIESIVIELDSFFGSILNFPEHYEKFKNDYIYERFLNGTCCTSTDYVFDHKELNIPYDQIFFILTLIFYNTNNLFYHHYYRPYPAILWLRFYFVLHLLHRDT